MLLPVRYASSHSQQGSLHPVVDGRPRTWPTRGSSMSPRDVARAAGATAAVAQRATRRGHSSELVDVSHDLISTVRTMRENQSETDLSSPTPNPISDEDRRHRRGNYDKPYGCTPLALVRRPTPTLLAPLTQPIERVARGGAAETVDVGRRMSPNPVGGESHVQSCGLESQREGE